MAGCPSGRPGVVIAMTTANSPPPLCAGPCPGQMASQPPTYGHKPSPCPGPEGGGWSVRPGRQLVSVRLEARHRNRGGVSCGRPRTRSSRLPRSFPFAGTQHPHISRAAVTATWPTIHVLPPAVCTWQPARPAPMLLARKQPRQFCASLGFPTPPVDHPRALSPLDERRRPLWRTEDVSACWRSSPAPRRPSLLSGRTEAPRRGAINQSDWQSRVSPSPASGTREAGTDDTKTRAGHTRRDLCDARPGTVLPRSGGGTRRQLG